MLVFYTNFTIIVQYDKEYEAYIHIMLDLFPLHSELYKKDE